VLHSVKSRKTWRIASFASPGSIVNQEPCQVLGLYSGSPFGTSSETKLYLSLKS
jgi:hypothetical protein